MNAFTLNENTGQVYTKVMLDREVKSEYMLCIEASRPYEENTERDLAALNSTNKILFVKVTVNDVNDLGPKFYEPRIKTGDISTYFHKLTNMKFQICTLMLRGLVFFSDCTIGILCLFEGSTFSQFCCFSELLDFLTSLFIAEVTFYFCFFL